MCWVLTCVRYKTCDLYYSSSVYITLSNEVVYIIYAYGEDLHLVIFPCERDFFLANQTLRILPSQSKTLPKQSFHRYNNLSHKEKLPNEGTSFEP